MGIAEDMRREYGEDVFASSTPRPGHDPRWVRLCVCGHLESSHSPSIGGTGRLDEPTEVERRGETFRTVYVFDGCRGAIRNRGTAMAEVSTNHETHVTTSTMVITCPCHQMRAVAEIDRPNRFFHQRVPRDYDPARHPLLVGLSAYGKAIAKFKTIGGDQERATAELDARFRRLDTWRCGSPPRCRADPATVWPVFVDGDRSELRCPAHR